MVAKLARSRQWGPFRYVNMANLQSPFIHSHTNLDVVVKVFFRCYSVSLLLDFK